MDFFYGSTKPGNYYLYDVKKQSLKFLFNEQKSLSKYKFREMKPVVIKSRDGLDLVCYLTRGDSTKKLIMLVHGGPWSRDSYGFNEEVQLLANRGYSVLQVNYRGSLGFGKKFTSAANMNFDKIRNDIIDAANWAIENDIADKDKIAIMGRSFGGYSALAGLTFTSNFFCCGVDISGPSNWLTAEEKVPDSWKPHRASWYKLVGDPSTKEGREFMLKNSPALYAKNIKKPLIIFQGERDPNVDKGEAERMVAAMEKYNIPVRYVVYPDEGHGFQKEANQISSMAIIEEFLSKTLGGWYEKMSTEETKNSSHKIVK